MTSSPAATELPSAGTFRATHLGLFLGVEGTGRQVHVTGMDIFRFEGDRIAEFWTEFNLMDLAEQIGAIPVAVVA